jgi:hypothetical protein
MKAAAAALNTIKSVKSPCRLYVERYSSTKEHVFHKQLTHATLAWNLHSARFDTFNRRGRQCSTTLTYEKSLLRTTFAKPQRRDEPFGTGFT